MPSAGRVNWAKFRVITVALVATAILATLTYLLTGGSLLQPRAEIYLFIPDGTGLEKGSPVRYDRVTVGKVSTVELSGSSVPERIVKVTILMVRAHLASIPADAFALISSETLIGDKFVDVHGGTSDQRLKPGAELTFKDEPDLVTSTDLTQFTRQLRQLDAVLDDLEQGRSQFGKFVQGSEFYTDLIKRLSDLNTGIHNAVSTTTTVGDILSTDRVHRQVSDLLTGLDQTLAKIQSGQGGAGQMLRDSATYDQALASVRQVRHSLADLERNPFLQSESAYTAWNQQLTAWMQSVDQINANPLLNSTFVYENLSGAADQLRNTLRDFHENPRKYLYLKLF